MELVAEPHDVLTTAEVAQAAIQALADRGDVVIEGDSVGLTTQGVEALYWLSVLASETAQGHGRQARLIRTRAAALSKELALLLTGG